MSDIQAVLFDKDGTLFNYGKVWGPIGSKAMMRGLSAFSNLSGEEVSELSHEIELKMGVDRDGNSYPRGVLFEKQRIFSVLLYCLKLSFRYRISASRLIDMIHKGIITMYSCLDDELPGMDFSEATGTIRTLFERGYKIGIVTNDRMASLEKFIHYMGIGKYVSFMRTGDSRGCRRKPHPDAMVQFCAEQGLSPKNVCMVGDSYQDMKFAKKAKAGRRIALLTGQNDVPLLTANSDAVYPSIGDILGDEAFRA